MFAGPFVYNDANKLTLQVVTLLLRSRLSDAIREELGATYSITVESQAARIPKPEYRLQIDWTCDPARAQSLIQRVMAEVDSVRQTLLVPDRVLPYAHHSDAGLREEERGERVPARPENLAPLRRRRRGQRRGGGQGAVADFRAERHRDSAGRAPTILDADNYVRVTLMPETK